MIPGSFEYHVPQTLDEAVALLARLGEGAKILAGGQSLLPAMRFRLASPEVLVDINRLRDLSYVEERGDHLAIGALTREHQLEESPLVARSYPLLLDTAQGGRRSPGAEPGHGGRQPRARRPRQRPSGNHARLRRARSWRAAPPARARSRSTISSSASSRPACGPARSSPRSGSPKPAAGSGGAYLKLERKVGDYAVAAVAVQLTADRRGRSAACESALTNVGPVPMRAANAEAALAGKAATDDVVEAAGRAAAAECDPSADLRGRSTTSETWSASSPSERFAAPSSAPREQDHEPAHDHRHRQR